MRLILIFIVILGLGGCLPLHMFQPDSARIQTKHWTRYGKKRPRLETVYCYKTLGDPACYTMPQRGKEHLLLNHDLAPTKDPERDAFWALNIQDPAI